MYHVLGSDAAPGPSWPFPDASWPIDPALADQALLDSIPADWLGNATLIVRGYEARTWGHPDSFGDPMSSVCRTYLAATHGRAMHTGMIPGGYDAMEQPMASFGTTTSLRFPADVCFKHVNSYTSGPSPAGSSWIYSGGSRPSGFSHWPAQHQWFQEVTGRTVAGFSQDWLRLLGGHFEATTESDGTVRIKATLRDHARFGYLLLRDGLWGTQYVLARAYVQRMHAGGPDGDGRPFKQEGLQTHLVRDGLRSNGSTPSDPLVAMPGCPDDTFFAYGGTTRAVIAVVPSRGLVLARWRHDGIPIETYLGRICEAVPPV